MKFIKKIFFFLFICTFFSTFSLANDSIYYIDVDYIIKNSNKGKSILSQLDEVKNKNLKNLKVDQEALINLEKDINQKKKYP